MSGPGANIVLSWVSELTDLEEQIEALQEAKRDFYSAVRDEHGKPVASGLKAAMRIHRMDSEKRADAEKVDEETFRILSIIEGQSLAPRATRVASDVPDHDPDTGEITESGGGSEDDVGHPIPTAGGGAVAGPDRSTVIEDGVVSALAGQARDEIPATHSSSENTSRSQHEVDTAPAVEAKQQCDTLGVTAGRDPQPEIILDAGPIPDFLRRTA